MLPEPGAQTREWATRWADDLATWAIPEAILAAAEDDPWRAPVTPFAARADRALAAPGGPSYDQAAAALEHAREEWGTAVVLDIGAGSGAAGLPLLATGAADRLVAVDARAEMLAALQDRAGAHAPAVHVVAGRWPDPAVVAAAGPADVVVCHHVLYDVPDVLPFVTAMSAAARERVVVELPPRHPMTWLNPLWAAFHGVERPEGPTVEDLIGLLESWPAQELMVTDWEVEEPIPAIDDERVALVTRRLCLPARRRPDVAAALADLAADDPDVDASRGTVTRRQATVSWRG